jgi:hypothetical protein
MMVGVEVHERLAQAWAAGQVLVAGVILIVVHVAGLYAERVHGPGRVCAGVQAARAALWTFDEVGSWSPAGR